MSSKEQKLKISLKIKQLHNEGKLQCGRKSVDIYDLQGNFIKSCISYKEGSEFIGISQKQFQSSMRRKAKRIKKQSYWKKIVFIWKWKSSI